MRSFFKPESDIWRLLGMLGDVLLLSMLWVVCSIPLVILYYLYNRIVVYITDKFSFINSIIDFQYNNLSNFRKKIKNRISIFFFLLD